MLEEISIQEFYEWIAFSELEPFDQERADMRSAHICATIANANRNPKKHPKGYTASDFMIYFGDNRPRKKTGVELKAVAKSIAAMFAFDDKKDARRRKPLTVRQPPARRTRA